MELKDKLEKIKKLGYTYNPESGIFYNKLGNECRIGGNGYVYVGNKNWRVAGHQFAWYIIYNEVPNVIDHIDRNKLNNKITNLRNVTKKENAYNTIKSKNSNGYTYIKSRKKYKSQITINNKHIFLGYYDTSIEAKNVYLENKINLTEWKKYCL